MDSDEDKNIPNEDDLHERICEIKKDITCKQMELLHLQNLEASRKNTKDLNLNRYMRQIILPNIRRKGQEILKRSAVLIVGVGGLGCPGALYLCTSGIGTIGLVDYDDVEISNLHRQVLHDESSIGIAKVISAANSLKRLNSEVEIHVYKEQLTSKNALSIIEKYDLVLDCTDNVPTRYLLNDACVLSGRSLICGSALQMEGQLTVYNYNDSPCYRCLFPTPPPPKCVNSCNTVGILPPVVGIIGTLQALQAIKILLHEDEGVLYNRWLLFDGTDTLFKDIKLRKKQVNCAVCGNNSSIKSLINYEEFCGTSTIDVDENLCLLMPQQRITTRELVRLMKEVNYLLIDVRSTEEYNICHLPYSLNFPIDEFDYPLSKIALINKLISAIEESSNLKIVIVCRRGNDSQRAVKILEENITANIVDLKGGLQSWAKEIDNNFLIC